MATMASELRRRQQQSDSTDEEIQQYVNEEDDIDNESQTSTSKRAKDEPFSIQIGTILLLFTLIMATMVVVIYYQASQPTLNSFREYQMMIASSPGVKRPDHVDIVMIEEEGLDEMPLIELDPDVAKHDAFGVAQQYLKNYTSMFTKLAQDLQTEFIRLNDGIRPSRYLLSHALMELQPGGEWARRLMEKQNKDLHMVVIGGSEAAGYGNHHEDSFSYILQVILQPIMQHFKINFTVSNIALEHVALFPYLWCIRPFLLASSDQPIDIVYADFGGGDSLSALELEQLVRQLWGLGRGTNTGDEIVSNPLLILRDSQKNEDRLDLLREYVEAGILSSPVLMEWNDAVTPFLQVKPSRRPPGFENWDYMVNAPHDNSKKSSYWTAAQHRMVAWIISMFFLEQLELVVGHEEGYYEIKEPDMNINSEMSAPILPTASSMKSPWAEYLYESSTKRECLSSFEPASNLIPVKGYASTDPQLEQPKGKLFYNDGWVLDLENIERKEKLQSMHLGFHDLLTSYHGISSSGKLEFNIDLEHTTKKLILCESQAPPRDQGCMLEHDVKFTMNGINIENIQRITSNSVSYLGKHHCFVLILPGGGISGKIRLGAQVSNEKVTIANGACSISHIVW